MADDACKDYQEHIMTPLCTPAIIMEYGSAFKNCHRMYTSRSNSLSFHVKSKDLVGQMSKDIGMGVRKGTVVSCVPTLFSCFLGIPSLYVFLVFEIFFVTLHICISKSES